MLHNRWIRYAAVAFVVFFLWTRPTQAGNTVQKVWNTASTAGDRAATFFTAVTR